MQHHTQLVLVLYIEVVYINKMNKLNLFNSHNINFISYNPDYLRNFCMPIFTKDFIR